MATATSRLQWIDDRWHLDGQGIHAGDGMEMRFPDGTWLPVRVESADRGHRLFAHFDYHGLCLCASIDDATSLRWPRTKVDALRETANLFGAASRQIREKLARTP